MIGRGERRCEAVTAAVRVETAKYTEAAVLSLAMIATRAKNTYCPTQARCIFLTLAMIATRAQDTYCPTHARCLFVFLLRLGTPRRKHAEWSAQKARPNRPRRAHR
jgi:hypothetical protein